MKKEYSDFLKWLIPGAAAVGSIIYIAAAGVSEKVPFVGHLHIKNRGGASDEK